MNCLAPFMHKKRAGVVIRIILLMCILGVMQSCGFVSKVDASKLYPELCTGAGDSGSVSVDPEAKNVVIIRPMGLRIDYAPPEQGQPSFDFNFGAWYLTLDVTVSGPEALCFGIVDMLKSGSDRAQVRRVDGHMLAAASDLRQRLEAEMRRTDQVIHVDRFPTHFNFHVITDSGSLCSLEPLQIDLADPPHEKVYDVRLSVQSGAIEEYMDRGRERNWWQYEGDLRVTVDNEWHRMQVQPVRLLTRVRTP